MPQARLAAFKAVRNLAHFEAPIAVAVSKGSSVVRWGTFVKLVSASSATNWRYRDSTNVAAPQTCAALAHAQVLLPTTTDSSIVFPPYRCLHEGLGSGLGDSAKMQDHLLHLF